LDVQDSYATYFWGQFSVRSKLFITSMRSARLQGFLDLFKTDQNSFCTVCFAITTVLGAAHFNKHCNADYFCSIRQSIYFAN